MKVKSELEQEFEGDKRKAQNLLKGDKEGAFFSSTTLKNKGGWAVARYKPDAQD